MPAAKDLSVWHPASQFPSGPNRIGPNLASAGGVTQPNGVVDAAGSVRISHPVHHVTGTAAIINLLVPYDAPGWQGEVTLIADAIWTWTAAGNIAQAGTVTAAGRQFKFVYDPGTNKWYPDKVA